jgi:predicted HTH transcriptional regulator
VFFYKHDSSRRFNKNEIEEDKQQETPQSTFQSNPSPKDMMKTAKSSVAKRRRQMKRLQCHYHQKEPITFETRKTSS